MKIFRNPDAMWREEEVPTEHALQGLHEGSDVSDLGTSIILMHGRILSLNILGTEIWKLCDGRTVDEIVSEMEKEFDVDPSILKKDVDSFIEELKGLGLLHEK